MPKTKQLEKHNAEECSIFIYNLLSTTVKRIKCIHSNIINLLAPEEVLMETDLIFSFIVINDISRACAINDTRIR